MCAFAARAQVRIRTTMQTPEQLAQEGGNLSTAQARELEQQVEKNPHDLDARNKLLGYYFYQWMQAGEEAARAARRRHVLWLIENYPDSPLIALYETSIDPKGHSLADPEGYDQARAALLKKTEEQRTNARIFGNAAKFLQLNDRVTAEQLLLVAQQLEPGNGEWAWRLGFLYGIGVLGVDALAFNGQPASVDPLEQDGPFAAKAKKELETSKNPMLLAVAGNVIARYGTILAPSERDRVGYLTRAEQLYARAQALDPKNPSWTQMLQQTRAWRAQMQSSEDPDGPKRGK